MKYLVFLFVMLLMVGTVFAVYIEDDNKLATENSLRIRKINMNPENLVPGEDALLNVELENGGELFVDNIRVKLALPSTIGFYKDVNKVKISRLDSGESKNLSFRILASPSAKEGIYEGYLNIDYVTNFGSEFSNVGDDQEDNYTLGIIIKSSPVIFVQLENSELYRGNYIGSISIKFVNNGLADIKFLTVELEGTKDYEIISGMKKYIGDLDSDDFDSVDFRLNVKSKKSQVKLPLKISYKDSLNEDYEEKIDLNLELRSSSELGIKNGYQNYVVLGIAIVAIAGYLIYKKLKRKHHHKSLHHRHK
ncbi:hypothetical protein CMI42_01145 [Candidatus Pacearchaeota archaeon]|nr:hypothetical protein [Candidatus Pacearchaeota archaeon]